MKIDHKLIRSPFREDKKPTCSFYYSKSNRLYLHDFATNAHIDCIEAVKLLYRINYSQAIDKILSDRESLFESEKLIVGDSKNYEFIAGSYSMEYFHKFGITDTTLLKYNVYPIKTLYCNETAVARGSKSNPLFAYCSSSGRIKWYRPLAKDSTKKWGGNTSAGDVWGFEQLPKKGQIVFITSSLKDVMVLHELGYNAICFNGEGYGIGTGDSARIVKDYISRLEKRFEHIIFYMDNDEPGIAFSEKLKQQYRKKYIVNKPNTPKDISDYVKLKSIHNGKRTIKRLLSKLFRVDSSFLDYLDFINTHNHFGAVDNKVN